jgi:hypothetical protein
MNAVSTVFTLTEPTGGVVLGDPQSVSIPLASKLILSGANGKDSIVDEGGTLVITAQHADGTSATGVTYAVYGMDGSPTTIAEINSTGILTAYQNGQVKVMATSDGDIGIITITIKNQRSVLKVQLLPVAGMTEANLSNIPVILFRESDRMTLVGTSDENGLVVWDTVPAGTWRAYIENSYEYIHVGSAPIVLGETTSAESELTLISLNQQGEETFNIRDIVWFVSRWSDHSWDFNGDGVSDSTDLLELLHRVQPVAIVPALELE